MPETRRGRLIPPLLLAMVLSSTSAHAQVLAYVANACSNNVSVIDTVSRTVVDTIPVGNSPDGIAITPDGAFAYVANLASGTISVISTASNSVIDTIQLTQLTLGAQAVRGIAVTPDGAFVYVTRIVGMDSVVSVIDTATHAVVATIPVAGGNGLAVAPNSAFVYVASRTTNTISVIQTSTQTVTATINLRGLSRQGWALPTWPSHPTARSATSRPAVALSTSSTRRATHPSRACR